MMSRGNDGQKIFFSDADRELFLETIGELAELIVKASKLIKFDIAKCGKAMRLYGEDKTKRDLVVYLIWRKGIATNEKIGQFFNMSYSAVSHCIKSFKMKMSKDEKLKKYFDEINSQFKL